MAEFTVGQEVLLVRLHRPQWMEKQEPERVTISRVGRKWVYIQRRSREEVFDAVTGREKSQHTSQRRIVDPIVYAREQQVAAARQWLRTEAGITLGGTEYGWTDERLLALRAYVEITLTDEEA